MPETDERLARALHDSYTRHRLAAGEAPGSRPGLSDWDGLPDEYKESSLRNARDVRRAVAEIGYDIRPAYAAPGRSGARLTERDVDRVAEQLHIGWMHERLAAGWRLGPTRSDRERTNPDLVAWSELPEERRDIDKQFARELPELLAKSGLELREPTPGHGTVDAEGLWCINPGRLRN